MNSIWNKNQVMKKAIRTPIMKFRGKPEKKKEIMDKRKKRIDEAVSWKEGESVTNPRKINVQKTQKSHEAYFLKPGKEIENEKNPNPNDMSPRVEEFYDDYRFDELWEKVAQIAIHDYDAFEILLVLIYRNAYLLDHKASPNLRYDPGTGIKKHINELENRIGHLVPGGIEELLLFIDLLGWNEDVKYQAEQTDYDLKDDFYVGRINTILTCIDVSYKLSSFVLTVLENSDNPEEINMNEGLETMQDLSISRGTSRPTKKETLEWLGPIYDN